MNAAGEAGRIPWRLAGALLAAAVLVSAAVMLLPGGATRLALAGILGLPALCLLVTRPEYVLAILIFMRFSNFDMFLPMSLFRPLSLLLVIAVAASWLDGRKIGLCDRKLAALILAFFLIAFQSIAFAEDIYPARDALESLGGVIMIIMLVLVVVDSRKNFLGLLAVLTAAVMVSNFLPFLLPPPGDYSSQSLMWEEGVMRYEGYQLEANYFAFHQVFIIPVLLFLLARFGRPRLLRPLLLAALAGTVFVLMLSFSRGGFVGLLVIVAALIIMERKNRTFMTAAALAVLVLAVAAPALYWDRITSLVYAARNISQDYAIMTRVYTIKVALILGLENPLFGTGIGNFIYEASRFVPFTKNVHSAFLLIFSELGFPGLIAVLAILARNLFILRSMMISGGERGSLGRFLMVQQVAVVTGSMFIPNGYEFIFWLALVLPSLADRAYRDEPPAPPERNAAPLRA